jgi:hypothetical protein
MLMTSHDTLQSAEDALIVSTASLSVAQRKLALSALAYTENPRRGIGALHLFAYNNMLSSCACVREHSNNNERTAPFCFTAASALLLISQSAYNV